MMYTYLQCYVYGPMRAMIYKYLQCYVYVPMRAYDVHIHTVLCTRMQQLQQLFAA